MSYSRTMRSLLGLGEGTTYDPPPSAYCTKYIAEIDNLKNQLVAAGRSCDSRLSSAAASAAGSNASMGKALSELQVQLNDAIEKNDRLTRDLSNRTCPTKSCFWWMVATAAASGVAIYSVVKNKQDKNKLEKPKPKV